jgi:hypothetical protein
MVTGAHVPADKAFCEALKLLMLTVDYRMLAAERADCAGGLTAWADKHRATAMERMLEGLDGASGR